MDSHLSSAAASRPAPPRFAIGLGLALAAILGLVGTASATNYYWSGTNLSSDTWNATSPTNWSSFATSYQSIASTPGSAPSTDNVFFYQASQVLGAPVSSLTTDLGNSISINSLNFLSGATNPVTIGTSVGGPNVLTLGAGGINMLGGSSGNAGAVTLNTNITLGATQTWLDTSTNSLTVNGVIGGGTSGLTLAGGGTTTNPGAFLFTGANTYTGATTLSTVDSTLSLSGANGSLASNGATAGIVLAGGTTLTLDNTSTVNNNRLVSTVGITSSGGSLQLLGTGASQSVGTFTLGTGTTNLYVASGSTLSAANLTRNITSGAVINFYSNPSGANPGTPLLSPGTYSVGTLTNTNGIIGAWATYGNVGFSGGLNNTAGDSTSSTNHLDFAALTGTTVGPLTTYASAFGGGSATNVKIGGTVATGSTQTINSLYLTGAALVTVTSGTTLTIGSGGIISNAATLSFQGAGPQIVLANAADLGSGTDNTGAGTAGGTPVGTLTAGVPNSTPADLVITTASNLRLDTAVIANNGTTVVNLTKNGSGWLDLSDGNGTTQTNTYTGITTINGGLVTVRADANLGTAPTSKVPNSITLNGGELRMTATFALSANRGITVGPQGGTISYNGGNTTTVGSYQVTGPGAMTYACIPGAGGVSNNTCAIELNMPTGANNYSGATTFFLQGSTISGSISAVIFFNASNLVPNSSAVTVTNSIATQSGALGMLNMFGTNQTFGSLSGNGFIDNGLATVSTLSVGGNNFSTTFSGIIGQTGVAFSVGAKSHSGSDNGTTTSAIALTKTGTGTLTLSGASQYTGATTINGGGILVTGSLANTATTVANSAFLGGSGTVSGAVTVQAGGQLAPAVTPTSTSTLTVKNNLTINAGGTLTYNFGSPGTSDNVVVGGSSAFNLTLNTGTDVLNVNQLAGAGFNLGTYTLLSNTSGGNVTTNGASTQAGAPTGALNWTTNAKTNFNYWVLGPGAPIDPTAGGGTVAANAIVLEVLQGQPHLTWKGTINGSWDTTTANWVGDSTIYSNGSNVTFDDVGVNNGATTISLPNPVSPNTITIANNSGTYSFSGAAITVSNSAGIVKNNGGGVVFNNNVTTPSLTVNGGTLTVGGSSTFTSTTLTTVAGGNLAVNGTLITPALNVTGGNLGGTGTVNGSGALGNPTITVSAGSVSPGTPGAPGTLTLGSASFNAAVSFTGAGAYNFAVVTNIGSPANPGTNPGGSSATANQNLLVVNGTLNMAATPVNFNATGTSFVPAQSYSWLIASSPNGGVTGTPVTGAASGDFGPYAAFFSLSATSASVYLNYVPQFIWTGATNSSWSVGTNWIVGAAPGSGQTAVFNNAGNGNTSISLGNTTVPIGGFLFDTASAAAYTLGTNANDAFQIDAGANITVTNLVTTTQTFNAQLLPLGALSVINNGTAPLTFNGNMSLASGGTAGALTFSGSGTTVFAGNIAAGSTTGIVINGPGVVALSGTNGFTGGIALNNGTLAVNGPSALGTGTLTIAGGSIDNTSTGPVNVVTSNPVNINASFGFGGTQSLGLGNGAVTLGTNATITLSGTGTLTFGGSLSGAASSLTVAGAGTGAVAFTGASNTLNNVTVNTSGGLVLGSAGGSTAVAGTITVGGGTVNQPDSRFYQFTVSGGSLTLNGAVTATGLSLASSATTSTSGQLIISGGSSLTVNSTSIVNIGANTATLAQTGALITAQGSASLSITAPTIVFGGGQGTSPNRANTTVVLGTGNNLLSASTAIAIGGTAGGGGGADGDTQRGDQYGPATIFLGLGPNTIQTPSLTVGNYKTPGYLFLSTGQPNQTAAGTAYTPSVYVAGASLTISQAGGGKTTMILGDQNGGGSGTNSTGILDTTAGLLTATFSTVTLGIATSAPTSGAGGAIGSWVLGVANNNVTLDTLNMASTPTATEGITAGVFSLNGGVVAFNSSTGTGIFNNATTFSNSVINLNGGTLNMNNLPIGTSSISIDNVNMLGGTLQNASAVFAGSGPGFTQTGGTIQVDTTSQAGATMTTTVAGSYTVAGAATVLLNAGTSGVVTLTTPTLMRSSTGSYAPDTTAGAGGLAAGTLAGTLDIIPATGNLDSGAGPNELLVISGGIGSAPTAGSATYPSLLAPWIVARTSSSPTASADFTQFDSTSNAVQRFSSYVIYASGTGLSSASPSDVGLVNAPQTLSASVSVFALKVQSAISDSGTNNLFINPAGGGMGGLIMDGGTIAIGGNLSFGGNSGEALIYTTGNGGTISSPIVAGALTTFGPGTLTVAAASPIAGTVNLNGGTLFLNSSGQVNAGGPVNVNNGATLGGTGSVSVTGTNTVNFGPKGNFAPGNGSSFGIFTITIVNGNVSTTTQVTNPVNLTSGPATAGAPTASGLGFGIGISPTNVVGSNITLYLGVPAGSATANTGGSTSVFGGNASGFIINASGSGVFTLDPITTVTLIGNPANFTPGQSYSFLVGETPIGSNGSVVNLANFNVSGFTGLTNASLVDPPLIHGFNAVYLNFTVAVPEPRWSILIAAAGLGVIVPVVRRRRRLAGSSTI